jgi:hypothetical protein
MKYLHSGTGDGLYHFVNPRQGNKITGKWALDNDCFNGPFNQKRFDQCLALNVANKANCLFIVMPDKVGDPGETMRLWTKYANAYSDWPRAFVAQDGQELLPFPVIEEWKVLFIGGSTEWKMSQGAIDCIRYAQSIGKRIHIGRINSYRRFRHFAELPGSKEFTCDGTMQRFMGKDAALSLATQWEKANKLQLRFPFSGGDSYS